MNADQILDMIGDAKGTYVWEARQEESGETRSPLRRMTVKRAAFIAALISVALLLVGCGAYVITRNLGWSWLLRKDLVDYNDTMQIGSLSKNWWIEDAAVELSAAPPTGTTLEITCSEWGQNTEGTLEIGGEYWIEKWDGETYREVPTVDGQPWIVPVQTVACGSESKWTVDFQASYGTLAPGNYRVGMMVSKTAGDGHTSQLGCFAKFRIPQENIAPYLETYNQALNALLNGEAYHIMITEYMENILPDSEYARFREEIWKSGENYANCLVVMNLGASDWRTEGAGQLLRDGSGYGLNWRDGKIDPKPGSWSKLDFVNANSFHWSSSFENVYTYAEDVEALENGVNIVTSLGLEEPSYFEIRVQYGETGTIARMEYARIPGPVYGEEDRVLWYTVEVLPTTEQKAADMLESIDVTTPPAFSYVEDMARIRESGYQTKTEGFQNTAAKNVPDPDTAVALAKAEVSENTNVADVYYDPAEEVWKVVLTYSQEDGIYYAVYINQNGVTLLVVSQ